MPYQDTIFGALLKFIPRHRFKHLVEQTKAGHRVRRLDPWSHLVAMLFAQLSGARSLRDVTAALDAVPGTHSHLGLAKVRRSTLADANAGRPVALFEQLLGMLIAQLDPGKGPREMLRLIDATRILAGRRIESWSPSGAVKLHVVYDPGNDRPTCYAVTTDRVNDITPAKAFAIEPGATYVFDKAYYDFAFWADLDAHDCRFVTRLKSNSPVHIIKRLDVGPDTAIVSDVIARLSKRLSGSRQNPYAKPVRVVEVGIDTGKILRLVTNDLSSPAEHIAALYKARWQVELFFKWIKQNLKIKHFMGTSPNAIRIQILTALIAYLLLRLAQRHRSSSPSLQTLARLANKMLMMRKPLEDLFRPPKHQTQAHSPGQYKLQLQC